MLEMSALDLSINTIMSHISHSHVLSRVTRLLTSLKNVAKLRDVQRCHVQSLPLCTVLSQVTLAVLGLSWNSLTSQHPCGRVSRYAGVIPQSQDYPGTPSPSSTPVSDYPGTPELYLSPGIILGLPSPTAPLWLGILIHPSYTGSPWIILGKSPYAEYLRN